MLSEQALLSHLLRDALGNNGLIDVVFDSSDLDDPQTFAELAAATPDVVLVRTCNDDNEAVVRRLVEQLAATKIIVLSEEHDSSVMVRAFDAGAAGCVALRLPLSSLIDVIARPQQKRPRSLPSRRPTAGPQPITDREKEVLRLIARGTSTREIAVELDITVATVRTHTQSILTKLGLHSKVEAAAYAVRNNLT